MTELKEPSAEALETEETQEPEKYLPNSVMANIRALYPSDSKFRNKVGIRYLRKLFYETTHEDKSSVLYTLKDYDHKGYSSLYRLYMEEKDPFEYRFANKYFENYDHWELLCECNWFQPFLLRWRKELELYFRSEQLRKIVADSKSSSGTAISSAKYVLEKGWLKAEEARNQRGRPTKAEIKEQADKMLRLNADFDNIFKINTEEKRQAEQSSS